MASFTFPRTLDTPPSLCSRETAESYKFYRSTTHANTDNLRPFNVPDNHYRNNAYAQVGAQEVQLRRVVSTVNLHPGPERRVVLNRAPDIKAETGLVQLSPAGDLRRISPWVKYEPFLPFPLEDGHRNKVPEVASKHRPGDHPFWQAFPNASPSREQVVTRPLRRAASSIQGTQDNRKQSSVSALLNFGWSRKGKGVEDSAQAFGQRTTPSVDVTSAKKERRIGRVF